MAVIVSNGATNLSTVNGFYRSEANNVGAYHATLLSLTSAKTIAVTFANAGNCQGIILDVTSNQASSTIKSITVVLQELVLGVWTDRATKTLSDTDISQGVLGTSVASTTHFILSFTGGTFPYAVNTTAGIWRFSVTQSGVGAADWNLRTSDGTNAFYVTWCDNAVSYTDNTDQIVCKDIVTIDQSATFKGLLGTGTSTDSTCAIVCRNTGGLTEDTISNLVWENAPASSYTLNIDGWMLLSCRGGFQVGSSASRIPTAQKAVINIISATSGTATNTGFKNDLASGRASLIFYGEIPAVEDAILASDANTGQANVVTTTNTGWVNGDKVFIGGQNVKAAGEGTVYTVDSVVTTTITLTSNILTNVRKAGGHIIRLNGYGIEIKGATTSPLTTIGAPLFLTVSGVKMQDWRLITNGTSTDESIRTLHIIEHSSLETQTGSTMTNLSIIALIPYGTKIDHCNMAKGRIDPPTQPSQANVTGPIIYTNNIALSWNLVVGATPANARTPNQTITDNFWENGGASFLQLQGTGLTFSRNTFYGGGNALTIGTILNSTNIHDNVFNNNSTGVLFNTSIGINVTMYGCVFGTTQTNTTDIGSTGLSYLDNFTFESPIQTSLIIQTANNQQNFFLGSLYGITNFNETANNDVAYGQYTFYQRTGTGLADTTARTAGGYALRIQPTSGTILSDFPMAQGKRNIPTGNIQNKTMTVSAWVYINNTAYDAGTYVMPTLNVKYDNATTVTAVATATFGSWQLLSKTFTPTTTYGQIEVWISGATDATGSNAYFYIDDTNFTQLPPDVSLNLGSLDDWANGTPVWPGFTTPALGTAFWDEQTSAHTATGTFGKIVKETEVETKNFLAGDKMEGA